MLDTRVSGAVVWKSLTGGGLGVGLIADGVINNSTGLILAGMVTTIGTAGVVVYGQIMAARTKGKIERDKAHTAAMVEREKAELEAEAAKRESLLKDYREREKDYKDAIKTKDGRIDVLQIQLIEAERRAARNYRDGNSTSEQHTGQPPQ